MRLYIKEQQALNKKNIAVLFGGCSSEYSVSLLSVYSVLKNLDDEKYNKILIGITKEGDWFRYYGSIDKIPDDKWLSDSDKLASVTVSLDRSVHGIIEYGKDGVSVTRIHCALPILHGKNGEDGTVQGVFELAGIPVAGCGSLGSSVCMNKHLAQRLAETVDVPVPKACLVYEGDGYENAHDFAKSIGYPIFVKPVKAGSSYGVTKILSDEELDGAIDFAFKYDNVVMVEEAIEGIEVACAIMGNKELIVGEIDEVELTDGFYDFEAKYFPKSTHIHVPARLDKAVREEIKECAARLYKALGCNGYARVDLFYTAKGVVFGEINTIPGFTEHSRFPAMMKAAGYSFSQVLDYFIENAK